MHCSFSLTHELALVRTASGGIPSLYAVYDRVSAAIVIAITPNAAFGFTWWRFQQSSASDSTH